MVILGTVGVAALIYICLIRQQYGKLEGLNSDTVAARKQLSDYLRIISQSSNAPADFAKASASLAEAEKDMASASGDNTTWTYNLITGFNKAYNLDMPDIERPNPEGMNALPHFPYTQQLTVRVGGSAYYHDLGRYIADFENKFPYCRLLNLYLEPAGTGDEKLNFRMDIVILVKPNS